MKLISWNVNGLRAVEKKGALESVFSLSPDILALQETKCSPDQLTEQVKQLHGYTSVFESATNRKGYSGVAVYTKLPFTLVHGTLGKKDFIDNEGRTLVLDFSSFYLINTYFPNGGKNEEHFEYKLSYYAHFLELVLRLEKEKPVIFCGDFNVAHREIDLARPKENANQIGFLPVERAFIDRVLAAHCVDTFREKHGETVKYSWWDQKTRARERNVGWRIDYIFTTKSLTSSIKEADILTDVIGSDHAPTMLIL